MRYVIIGAGQVGTHVGQFLSQQGHTVTIIDKDRKRIIKLQNRLDCKIIVDDGQKQDALLEARIQEAHYFIATTNSDETNLICCSLIRKLAPNVKCIARLRNSMYLEYIDNIMASFNIFKVVQPEREVATSIVRSIEYGGAMSDAFSFIDFNHILIRTLRVQANSPLIGTKLNELTEKIKLPPEAANNYLIAMINRDEDTFLPTGSDIILEGDELYIFGSMNTLDTLFQQLGTNIKDAKNIRKIIIIGGNTITRQILDIYNSKTLRFSQLIGKRRIPRRNIVVVEANEKTCYDLSGQFPETPILALDVTEDQALEDIEISAADLVIAATESSELNIVVAAHSHNLGVKQTIAVTKTRTYSEIASELGINISFSIRGAVANSIINHLRGQDAVLNIHEGNLSFFTHSIDPESSVKGKAIRDLRLPKNSLIIYINRKEQSFIARGDIRVEEGDQLLILSKQDAQQAITQLLERKNKKKELSDEQ